MRSASRRELQPLATPCHGTKAPVPGERETTPGRGKGATATLSSPLPEKEEENSSLFKRNKTTAALWPVIVKQFMSYR